MRQNNCDFSYQHYQLNTTLLFIFVFLVLSTKKILALNTSLEPGPNSKPDKHVNVSTINLHFEALHENWGFSQTFIQQMSNLHVHVQKYNL